MIAIFHNNASSRVQRRWFTRKNWKLRFLPQARVSVSLGTMNIWMRNSDLTWPPPEHMSSLKICLIIYFICYFISLYRFFFQSTSWIIWCGIANTTSFEEDRFPDSLEYCRVRTECKEGFPELFTLDLLPINFVMQQITANSSCF